MKIRMLAPLLGVLLLGACEDDLMIEDFNNAGLESLTDNPTRTAIGSAAVGLLVSGRDEIDDRNGYVSLLGILGRESYNFDGSDPRFITEMLESDLNPSSPAFGGNLWDEQYANIRTANIILAAVDQIDSAEMPEEEKAATRGFVKTMQAHEFLIIINTRDVNGAVIDVDRDPTGPPGALAGKSQVLDHIASLLDEATADLDGAGEAFPFSLTSGFVGFDTPESFREANRALAARVHVYREDWTAANDALNESFLSLAAPLDMGIFHVFSTASGDVVNELFDPGAEPDILAHPSIVDDAEACDPTVPSCGTAPGDFNTLDFRVQSKVRNVASQTQLDITTDKAFIIYRSNSAPIPIIRNEELILLRAEVDFQLNSIGNATTNINFIRQSSGGLVARTDLDAGNILDEIVFQRRYSLLFEGGHRWIDARRLGRIDQLPLDPAPSRPTHQRNTAFPIPESECLARGLETCAAGS